MFGSTGVEAHHPRTPGLRQIRKFSPLEERPCCNTTANPFIHAQACIAGFAGWMATVGRVAFYPSDPEVSERIGSIADAISRCGKKDKPDVARLFGFFTKCMEDVIRSIDSNWLTSRSDIPPELAARISESTLHSQVKLLHDAVVESVAEKTGKV